ncbi:MAG: DeoR/GlpR family DNA-binding transcription regulator [Actinomycetota bacterium]
MILEVVRDRHAVRVSTLSALLGVSEVTVRRDLEDLEHRGLLERTHGGAISTHRMGPEPAYVEAMARNPDAKRAIGEAAAALVEPGDTIFLNGGTTTLEVFRHVDVADVRVVTNHVGIALEAADRDVGMLLVGGEYRAPSHSCVGTFACDTVRRVFATKSFVGVEGISLRSGLTTPVADEAEIARLMIEQTSGVVTVVADHTKMGTVADFGVAPLDAVSRLVTDVGIDDGYRDDLRAHGLEVVVAGEHVGAPSRGG